MKTKIDKAVYGYGFDNTLDKALNNSIDDL